ncbi:hypothetical protein [Pseudomonas sp.]|uniref:hypothetical protein n=1 Tax=Pseudomonas sp. TaxID=306 RepID=UPI00289E9259|nr:hypothetical protein [Pseudomonas sp.]
MSISPSSEEGRKIVKQSRALFQNMEGAVLNFHRLCSFFSSENAERGAEIAELLCRPDVKVLKHVYFFLDDDDMPLQLSNELVHHYIRHGEFYHPRSHELVEPEIADSRIVIEFEVLP